MNIEPAKTDGTAIRRYRKLKGLLIVELAEQVGITDGYLGRIEKCQVQGSPKVILRIANALGVTTADITKDDTTVRQPVAA